MSRAGLPYRSSPVEFMVSHRLLSLAAALALGCVLGLPGSLRAAQDTWAVARMSGSATIALPGAPAQPLIPGMFVPLGSRISTAASGRVLLQRGTTSMMVSPATVIEVVDGAGMMRVIERRGTIELEVEKRGVPYFSVETPMLSAVVKGTRFTVTATPRGNAVAVDRGLVQVTDRASGQRADVPSGRAAATSRETGGGLALGPAASVDRSTGQFSAGTASRPSSTPSATSTSAPSSSASTTTRSTTTSSGSGTTAQGTSGTSSQVSGSSESGSGSGKSSSSGSSAASASSSSGEGRNSPSGSASAASSSSASSSGSGSGREDKSLNKGSSKDKGKDKDKDKDDDDSDSGSSGDRPRSRDHD